MTNWIKHLLWRRRKLLLAIDRKIERRNPGWQQIVRDVRRKGKK